MRFPEKSLRGLHLQSAVVEAKCASKRVRRSCGGAAESMGWECATGGHYLDPHWSTFVPRAQPTAAGARQSAVSPGANYFMSGTRQGRACEPNWLELWNHNAPGLPIRSNRSHGYL